MLEWNIKKEERERVMETNGSQHFFPVQSEFMFFIVLLILCTSTRHVTLWPALKTTYALFSGEMAHTGAGTSEWGDSFETQCTSNIMKEKK